MAHQKDRDGVIEVSFAFFDEAGIIGTREHPRKFPSVRPLFESVDDPFQSSQKLPRCPDHRLGDIIS